MHQHDSIKAVIKSERVRVATNDIETELQKLQLSPQEQIAVLANLAVKQVSVLPMSNNDACEFFTDLMSISQT
jgi:beta-lactamase class D